MSHSNQRRTVLVVGASGMLGHKLYQRLPAGLNVVGAARVVGDRLRSIERPHGRLVDGLEAASPDTLNAIVRDVRPDVVINCVGVIKQRDAETAAISSITTNALFPHQLAEASRAVGAQFIHISTDCVFSGTRGGYGESDFPDPVDLYGRSKLLGEVHGPGALTIRTSMIGRELSGYHSLLEWFLGQKGPVRGFTRAVFSGVTTLTLADEIGRIICEHGRIDGLYHLAGDPIAKHDLLGLVRDAFRLEKTIVADDSLVIDRSLNGERYKAATGFVAASWPVMIRELAADDTRLLYGAPNP